MNLTKPPLTSPFLLNPSPYRNRYHHQLRRTSASNGDNTTTTSTGQNNQDQSQPPLTKTPKPKKKLKVKRRRGGRDEQEERLLSMSASSPGRLEKEEKKKSWDEMTLTEKAIELYVGEKGALFWLNKFAYASIFIMAGIWILFRFVGPSIGLYQLDKPVLPPSSMFG